MWPMRRSVVTSEAVRDLVRLKANVNATQADGSTAMHWVVQSDDLELADLLIKAGAKVSMAERHRARRRS